MSEDENPKQSLDELLAEMAASDLEQWGAAPIDKPPGPEPVQESESPPASEEADKERNAKEAESRPEPEAEPVQEPPPASEEADKEKPYFDSNYWKEHWADDRLDNDIAEMLAGRTLQEWGWSVPSYEKKDEKKDEKPAGPLAKNAPLHFGALARGTPGSREVTDDEGNTEALPLADSFGETPPPGTYLPPASNELIQQRGQEEDDANLREELGVQQDEQQDEQRDEQPQEDDNDMPPRRPGGLGGPDAGMSRHAIRRKQQFEAREARVAGQANAREDRRAFLAGEGPNPEGEQPAYEGLTESQERSAATRNTPPGFEPPQVERRQQQPAPPQQQQQPAGGQMGGERGGNEEIRQLLTEMNGHLERLVAFTDGELPTLLVEIKDGLKEVGTFGS